MRRSLTTLCVMILAAAALAVQGYGDSRGDAGKPAARDAAGGRAPADQKDPGFIVHEWGTFTTFSGSDGIHLEYRPLDTNHQDLPSFVVDRLIQSGQPFMAKARIRAKVRMETPVTYFYTDRQRKVRVSVDFPEGLLTEFYPPVRKMAPTFDRKAALGDGEMIGNSTLDWGEVDLIPLSTFRPDVGDDQLADFLQQRTLSTILPQGDRYSHYVYARETDSALVHVNLPAPTKPNTGPRGSFIEKFLFYRGVGKFQLPVHVRFNELQQAVIANDGKRPLRSMILLDIKGDVTRMAVLPALAAESTAVLPEPQVVQNQQVGQRVIQALVEEGLYEKEAVAMVRTWQDSWITEQGTRLLYMVPEEDTERLLPLHIEPAPAKSVRVLVGRLEIMDPAQEREVTKLVDDHLQARRRHAEVCQKLRKEKGDEVKLPALPLPDKLVKMDRFAEPALARVIALTNHQAIRYEAKRLIYELKAQK